MTFHVRRAWAAPSGFARSFLMLGRLMLIAFAAILLACSAQEEYSWRGPARSVRLIVESGAYTRGDLPFDPLEDLAAGLRERLYVENGYRTGDDVVVTLSLHNLNVLQGYYEIHAEIMDRGRQTEQRLYYQSIPFGGTVLVPPDALDGSSVDGIVWDRLGNSGLSLDLAIILARDHLGRPPRQRRTYERDFAEACRADRANTIAPDRSYADAVLYVSGQKGDSFSAIPGWVARGELRTVQVSVSDLDVARAALPPPLPQELWQPSAAMPGREVRHYFLQAPGAYEMSVGRSGDPDCATWDRVRDARRRNGWTLGTDQILAEGECLRIRRIEEISAPYELRLNPGDSSGRDYWWGRLDVQTQELLDRATGRVVARIQRSSTSRYNDSGNRYGDSCSGGSSSFHTVLSELLQRQTLSIER